MRDHDSLQSDGGERATRSTGDSELSEADQKFLDGKRSHPEGDTIAYCPGCEKELDDFDLRTGGQQRGRCRACGKVAWMSFEAQELMLSEFVTLSSFRNARSVDTDSERNGDADA